MGRPARKGEGGFTLIELLIAISVSGLIISALGAGFIAAMRGLAGSDERFMASNAAQTLVTYFTTDVQSADPGNVHTDAVGTGCAASAADTSSTNVLRLQWSETSATTTNYFASYRMQQSGTEWQLVRYYCSFTGTATAPTSHIVAHGLSAPGESFSDGLTTSGSTTLTSSSAGFTALDVGSALTGTNIPGGATVASFMDAQHVVMSAAATGTGSKLTFTVGRGQRFTDGTTTNGSTTLSSPGAGFAASDVGRILAGANIPAGTKVASITDPQHVVMSAAATGTGSSLTFSVGRFVRTMADGTTTKDSTALFSTSAAFGAGDVGRALTGTNIPSGTTITAVTDTQHAVMSNAASATGSSLAVGVGAPSVSVAVRQVSLTLSAAKPVSDVGAPFSYTVSAGMRSPVPYPYVVSMDRVAADGDPTNLTTVHWQVVFNKKVNGVVAGDFTLLPGAGVSGQSIISVVPKTGTLPDDTYTVTANAGSGDGSLGLYLSDNDTIVDTSSPPNDLGGAGTGNGDFNGQAFTIDRMPPTVTVEKWVNPDDPTQYQADPATTLPILFTVTFSEAVSGFDASDVHLAGTTAPGAPAATVTGSGATYQVSVDGLTGSGAVIASVPAGSAADGAGNTNAASTSTDNNVQFNKTKAATTTSVTSPGASVVGQTVTYTATVAPNPSGPGTPTGSVEFFDGGVAITACSGQPLGGGSTASCGVSYAAPGSHTITAQYLGDSNFAASPTSASITQIVNQAATTTSVTSSGNPSLVNETVTYTATISVTAPGAGTPTGRVEFFDAGAPVATCGGSTGQMFTPGTPASCAVLYTTTGTHTITAQYLGDGNFLGSALSGALVQTVNGATIKLFHSAGNGFTDDFSGTTTIKPGTLTLRVYSGSSVSGSPAMTYTTSTFTGTSSPYGWSKSTGNKDLTSGAQYTAQATFVDGSGNVSVSSPVTFSAK